MDKGVEGWIYKTANKHYWRVASWYDFDDLVQDGFLCYFRTCARYTQTIDGQRRIGVATETKHIMRLFQTSFTNHIHDLARAKTRQPDMAVEQLPDTMTEAEGYERLIAEAPPLIARVISDLVNGDAARLRSPFRRRADGTRETLNERLCRIIGIPVSEAPRLHTELRSYLSH